MTAAPIGGPGRGGGTRGGCLPDQSGFPVQSGRDPFGAQLRFRPPFKGHFASDGRCPPLQAAPHRRLTVPRKGDAGHRNRPAPLWWPSLCQRPSEAVHRGLKNNGLQRLGRCPPRAVVCAIALLAAPKGTASKRGWKTKSERMHHQAFQQFLALTAFTIFCAHLSGSSAANHVQAGLFDGWLCLLQPFVPFQTDNQAEPSDDFLLRHATRPFGMRHSDDAAEDVHQGYL